MNNTDKYSSGKPFNCSIHNYSNPLINIIVYFSVWNLYNTLMKLNTFCQFLFKIPTFWMNTRFVEYSSGSIHQTLYLIWEEFAFSASFKITTFPRFPHVFIINCFAHASQDDQIAPPFLKIRPRRTLILVSSEGSLHKIGIRWVIYL